MNTSYWKCVYGKQWINEWHYIVNTMYCECVCGKQWKNFKANEFSVYDKRQMNFVWINLLINNDNGE